MSVIYEENQRKISCEATLIRDNNAYPSYDSDRKSKIRKNIGIRPMMVEPMIVKRDEY